MRNPGVVVKDEVDRKKQILTFKIIPPAKLNGEGVISQMAVNIKFERRKMSKPPLKKLEKYHKGIKPRLALPKIVQKIKQAALQIMPLIQAPVQGQDPGQEKLSSPEKHLAHVR